MLKTITTLNLLKANFVPFYIDKKRQKSLFFLLSGIRVRPHHQHQSKMLQK